MFGDINYVDTGASSACEMVVALLQHGKLPFDAEVALSLMLGLVTDSRSFQNEGLRASAHLAAARILETGVDTSPILNMLNSGKAESDLRVQGFGLSHFQLHCQKRLASLVIHQSDLVKLGASFGNVFGSGLFNQLLAMRETYASVVIFEREDGMSFCEFRSRGGIDVKEVAVAMGGGGHVPASGCSRAVSVDELAAEAIERMTRQVDAFFSRQEKA
jgi:phosphoesterase RecJ-like protein